MHLVIFGASSGVGKQVAAQAIANGHVVTGISRSLPANGTEKNLQYLQGDITDAAFVTKAIVGADVIISAIGIPNPKQPIRIFSTGAQILTDAMKSSGCKRLIIVSAGGATTEKNDSFFNRRILKPILWHFLRYLYDDMVQMERIVEASNLDWTIMRLARLTNGASKAKYRTAQDAAVPRGMSISRADVGHYIAQHLDDPADYQKHVSIAY